MSKQLILAACAVTLLGGCMHTKAADAAKTETPAAETAADPAKDPAKADDDNGGQGGGERVGN